MHLARPKKHSHRRHIQIMVTQTLPERDQEDVHERKTNSARVALFTMSNEPVKDLDGQNFKHSSGMQFVFAAIECNIHL